MSATTKSSSPGASSAGDEAPHPRARDELEIDIFSPAHDVYLRPPHRRPGRGAVYRLASLVSDRHPAQPIVHRVPPIRKAVYRAESFAPPVSKKLRPYTHPPGELDSVIRAELAATTATRAR